jgi:hypothetical protein
VRRAELDEGREEFAPPPRAGLFFTWCGLGLGLFFALVLVAQYVLKLQTPPVVVAKLSPQEEEAIAARRLKFKKTAEEEDRLAQMEFDKKKEARVSFAQRNAGVAEILTTYVHTSFANHIAAEVSKLRQEAEDAAFNATENSAAGAESEAEPAPAESAAPPAPEPAQPEKQGNPDDIGGQPGKDDGQAEL